MNLGMLSGLLGGDDRRKKFMEMAQGAMKNPEAMKAIGGLAGGMGGAEGAGASASGAEGGAGGLGGLLGGLKTPQMGPGGTAGFNPAAADSLPKLGRPMGGADSGLINRPQSMPNQMPQLQRPEMPPLEPIRDSVNIQDRIPSGQASVTNHQPQTIPLRPNPALSGMLGDMRQRDLDSPVSATPQQAQTQMLAQRPIGEVRPPDFMGRKGATMEDTPMSHERYGYQTQYMKDGRIPRRWQDILANSLHGAAEGFKGGGGWEGALGGAAAGGIGSAVSPIHARDYRFNKEQMPRLQADRAELERGQDRSFEMQKRGADLEGSRARTQATIAGMKDPQLERLKTESLIAKQNAQAEAIRTGKPQEFMHYDANTGQYIRGWKYPDGREEYGGQSGEAQLKLKGYENQREMNDADNESGMERTVQQGKQRMEQERYRQGATTGRAGMAQAGQDRRQKERLGAQYGDTAPSGVGEYGPAVPPQGKAPAVGSTPVKRATQQNISEYAEKFGVSPAEARKRFEAKGYRVE